MQTIFHSVLQSWENGNRQDFGLELRLRFGLPVATGYEGFWLRRRGFPLLEIGRRVSDETNRGTTVWAITRERGPER
jgi:hypothetical protein